MKGVRPDVSALASASRDLLNRGDVAGAEQVLKPVFDELWADASVWHLMGLIKQAQKRPEEAERYLRRAVADALTEGTYYNDLGVALQARGEFAEAQKVFRAAIALMPLQAACRVNLVHCLMAASDLVEAEREARAYIAAIPGSESWTMLSVLQRSQGRFEEALASAEEALRFSPRVRGLRHSRAIALDRLGRSKEALAAFEQLAREDLETPELAINFARALYQEGRAEDAETVLTQAAEHWPDAVTALQTLARMQLLRGMGEKSAAPLEAAIAARPGDASLRLACADFLNRNGFHERARVVLEDALRAEPEAPALLASLGLVLDSLDRTEEGLAFLRRADARTGGTAQTQRNLIGPMLRSGNAPEALEIIRTLRRTALRDQYLLAAEATALRLMGDPGYSALCDYAQQVKAYEIPPPQGFFTAENFNLALSECLRHQLKSANALDQTIPNGQQTPRDLRQVGETNLHDFFAVIDAPIRRYLSGLKADDPVGRRRSNGYRLRGAWATLLSPGGFIANHVHEGGWITGLYVVETPLSNGQGPNKQAGWLKFGETPWRIEACGPELWSVPQPGALTLFPSYFWHGVEALVPGRQRLTIGFEVIPA